MNEALNKLQDDDPSHDDIPFFQNVEARRLTGWRFVPDLSLWVCQAQCLKRDCKPAIATYDGEFFKLYALYSPRVFRKERARV